MTMKGCRPRRNSNSRRRSSALLTEMQAVGTLVIVVVAAAVAAHRIAVPCFLLSGPAVITQYQKRTQRYRYLLDEAKRLLLLPSDNSL